MIKQTKIFIIPTIVVQIEKNLGNPLISALKSVMGGIENDTLNDQISTLADIMGEGECPFRWRVRIQINWIIWGIGVGFGKKVKKSIKRNKPFSFKMKEEETANPTLN